MSAHIPAFNRRLAHRAGPNTGETTSDSGASGNSGNPSNNGNSGQTGNSSGNSNSQGSSNSGSQTSSSDASGATPSTTESSQSSQSTTSSQSSSSSSVSQATLTSSSSSTAVTTSSTAAVTSTQSTTSSSSTALTTSSSSLSTSSSSSAPVSVSTSTHFSTVTPPAAAQTSSFASVSRIFSSTSVVGAESTSSAKPSGAINTGAIVGGIAGALAGLAILGFLVAFFMRRVNRRKRALRFEAAQFRRSAMVLDDDDHLPVPRPLEMVQNRGNNFTDSVTSTTSPGLAGAGAYRFQEDHQAQNTEHGYYPDTAPQQYYDESQAVPMQRAPLQPRQQYTFGEVPGAENQQGHGNLLGFDAYDFGANDAHQVGQAHGDYTAYSPSQPYHAAGAHRSGQHTAKSSISSRMDEADAYGGI